MKSFLLLPTHINVEMFALDILLNILTPAIA
jgi:hypothetical protein